MVELLLTMAAWPPVVKHRVAKATSRLAHIFFLEQSFIHLLVVCKAHDICSGA